MFSELQLFDQAVRTPLSLPLGSVVDKTDIRSKFGTFRTLPDYTVAYPRTVVQALGELYTECNHVYNLLVVANREWETDYRYCTVAGHPLSFPIRIDMVGLPQSFLDAAADMSVESVREVLRRRIFEFEISPGMYQALEKIPSHDGEDSQFKLRFRAFLDGLRRRFGKPIALLAVTEEKYLAMKATEFGKEADEPLTDAEVRELSGFDRFFSPEEFRGHVKECGTSMYLLCARTSDPVEKFKNPSLQIGHPLLGDPAMRRVIKEHSLTLNIDNPDWPLGDPRRINDTKASLEPLGMGFSVTDVAQLISREFFEHLFSGRAYSNFTGESRLSENFATWLRCQEVDPKKVEAGEALLRAKPIQGVCGSYGQVSGSFEGVSFKTELCKNIRQRGPYVIQPEMPIPSIANASEGIEYTYIDRNTFAMVDGYPQFFGGLRLLMPKESAEAKRGRNHGNNATVYVEIR